MISEAAGGKTVRRCTPARVSNRAVGLPARVASGLLIALSFCASVSFAHDVRLAGPAPGLAPGSTVEAFDDGRIVVVGGGAQIWNPQARRWEMARAAEQATRRYFHTATRTDDGRLLLIGGVEVWNGFGRQQNALASVAVWKAAVNSWESGPSLLTPRVGHAAVRLPTNDVLVTGGSKTALGVRAYGPLLASTELVGERTTLSRATMVVARAHHTASLLPDRRVLVTGGLGDPEEPLSSTEFYDIEHDIWEPGPGLLIARSGHSATVLKNGAVLVVGGVDASGNTISITEVLQPGAAQWERADALAQARAQHQATVLSDGDILISGGLRTVPTDSSGSPALSLERYRAATGKWEPAGEMPLLFRDHRATRIDDDVVLLFGSDPYGSATLAWLPDEPESIRVSSTMYGVVTQLTDGRFLLTGGHRRQEATATALIYDPRTDRWTSTRPMHWARSQHRALLLRDGRVVVLGGEIHGAPDNVYGQTESPQYPAEIWDPATGQWTLSVMLKYRSGSGAEPALLGDGRVMLATANPDGYADAIHHFRIWNPSDDSITQPIQVRRTRPDGQVLYYADGHLLYAGGNDVVERRQDPRCTGELDEEGDYDEGSDLPAATVDPCTMTKESSREGKRLDWWDPAQNAWRELRPAELSLNGADLFALPDGGVLAWHRPRSTQAEEPARFLLAWQPQFGWRTLPLPPGLRRDQSIEPFVLPDGELLLRIGGAQTWLWNKTSTQWQKITEDARWSSIIGPFNLSDGRTLVFRGRESSDSAFGPLEAVWLNRAKSRWELQNPRYTPRAFPALVPLDDTHLMVVGGELSETKIWDSQADTWSDAGHTTQLLRAPLGLLLKDGRVMVAGVLANDENQIGCELWQPEDRSWISCGTFPSERYIRRSLVLRYLDDHQVLLVHGQQRALIWTEREEWMSSRLLMPKNISVPAPNPKGTPFLNNLASVWNPAKKGWEDATDVLFANGLGWSVQRTAEGDVLATAGRGYILRWESATKKLTGSNPHRLVHNDLEGLGLTGDGCGVLWTNSSPTHTRDLPAAVLGELASENWAAKPLGLQLPFNARAAALPDGQLIIAGQARGTGAYDGGLLRLRATCADLESRKEQPASYMPVRDVEEATQEPRAAAAPIPLPARSQRTLAQAWVETQAAHIRAVPERIKSKLAFGILLVWLLVRFFLNRWGEYHVDENGAIAGRSIDVAVLCACVPLALVAVGTPFVAVQKILASTAAIVAAFAAARLYVNAGEIRDKAIAGVPLLLAGSLAVLVIGTYVGDALYGLITFLTDFS